MGKYTVEATAASFERFVQQNIALDVDQELTVDITLAVGAQTQTVTVTEAPPTVNTSNAVLGSDHRARAISSVCRWSTATSTPRFPSRPE